MLPIMMGTRNVSEFLGPSLLFSKSVSGKETKVICQPQTKVMDLLVTVSILRELEATSIGSRICSLYGNLGKVFTSKT